MKVTKIKPAFVSGGGPIEPEPPPPAEERMEMPAGGIVMYTGSSAPTDFTKVENLRFVMASSSTVVNKTPTADSLSGHTHTVPDSSEAGAHTHDMSSDGAWGDDATAFASRAGDAVSPPTHTHSASAYGASTSGAHTHAMGNLAANAVQAPFLILNFIKNTSGGLAVAPVGSIVMFDGAASAIPDGWAICDGNNGTVDLRERFAFGANANGGLLSSGGSKTHTHVKPTVGSAGAHTHSYNINTGNATGSGNTAWEQSAGSSNVAWPGHKHPARSVTTTEQAAHAHEVSQPNEASHMPPYVYLYYIQRTS